MSVTFVTAFRPVRSGLDSYIEKFDKYASLNIPIVLFLDKDCVLPKEYPNVKVIQSTLDIDWIPNDVELPKQRNDTKDSREYLILMLHKMKYMNDALAHCETPYLAWIDFGISHIIRNPEITFKKLIELQSFSDPLTTILSPGCWGRNDKFVKDTVYWRFCGGFFLGPRHMFPIAYERQTLLVKQHLPALTWEVNYWAVMEDMFTWYSADHDDSMIMNIPHTYDWTVVTGYFDLTRMPDASSEIRARPLEHYLQYSTSTLTLDQNMVIFCEPHTYEYIRAKRPQELQARTKYVVVNFEDFPMCKYRELLNQNRQKIPDFDERNTVSYYLLCMARYAMLKQTIAENPFGSTHFLWLNICIERMGMRNVRELPRVFQIHRDKFSSCYIDYQRPENYLENVMRWGRCGLCSGFFTGNAQYMKEFCDRIEDKFIECAKLGYGHADEQLFSLVYFDKPDIFEVYYGDYTEMITNYEWIKERCSEPLRLLIQHSYDAGDFRTCLPACEKLLESCKRGYAVLSEDQMGHLLSILKQITKR